MRWYSFRLPMHGVLYVSAGDEKHAVERAHAAGFMVTKSFWGPFKELWEVSAKDRFCEFDGNGWHDKAPKDKKYRKMFVRLEDHLKHPDIFVLAPPEI